MIQVAKKVIVHNEAVETVIEIEPWSEKHDVFTIKFYPDTDNNEVRLTREQLREMCKDCDNAGWFD